MTKKLRLLDLFSGIGGFSLGLERAGFQTVAFCEVNPKCRHLLAHHWPQVPCYDDIRTLTAERLAADGITVDAICGGFPCQDISLAGPGGGLEGVRSGLWFEYLRLVRELRPKFVFVENVSALLGRGLGVILGGMASLGYDAWWDCIQADEIGADHERDRVWIVFWRKEAANADGPRLPGRSPSEENAFDVGKFIARMRLGIISPPNFPRGFREHKPLLGGRVHGIPGRVDRLHGLGNAVVPQIPEILGRAVLAAMNNSEAA